MIIEHLPVKLTEREVREKGERLAELVREHKQLENERKDAAASYKAKLDTQSEAILDLAAIVRAREETRPVECSETHDSIHAIVITYRDDTGEVVRSRPMTASELAEARQGKLFSVEPEKAPA